MVAKRNALKSGLRFRSNYSGWEKQGALELYKLKANMRT